MLQLGIYISHSLQANKEIVSKLKLQQCSKLRGWCTRYSYCSHTASFSLTQWTSIKFKYDHSIISWNITLLVAPRGSQFVIFKFQLKFLTIPSNFKLKTTNNSLGKCFHNNNSLYKSAGSQKQVIWKDTSIVRRIMKCSHCVVVLLFEGHFNLSWLC